MKPAAFLALIFALMASGCAKSNPAPAPKAVSTENPRANQTSLRSPLHATADPVSNDLFLVDWDATPPIFDHKAKRTTTTLNIGLNALVHEIETNAPVSTNEIIALVLRKHWQEYRKSSSNHSLLAFDELSNAFENSVSEVNSVDPHQIKLQYEEIIGKNLSQEIRYNSDALTVAHVVNEARLQCYSGTIYHLLAELRTKGAKAVQDEKQVVIFENGHILPGYLVSGKDDVHLFGVETTVAGKGQVYYGPVSKITGPIRIVDALDFFLIELLRDRFISVNKMVLRALQKNSLISGLDVLQTERAINLLGRNPIRGTKSLGGTPLSFGWAENSEGDQIRVYQDYSTKNDLPFLSPETVWASNRGI